MLLLIFNRFAIARAGIACKLGVVNRTIAIKSVIAGEICGRYDCENSTKGSHRSKLGWDNRR
jgi:hypothetical protein